MTTQPTCADRIDAERASRLAALGALNDLAQAYDAASLGEALEDSTTRELFGEIVAGNLFEPELRAFADHTPAEDPDAADIPDRAVDDVRERALDLMRELPLAVSRKTVFRIDISTGGPADWFEVFADMKEGPADRIERIVYHFADWFDHAEVTLEGHDFDMAADFARALLYELSE